MAANRTFSALAIISLALGIGANTAIFSFMDSILLRSLPVADSESLVILSWNTNRAENHGLNRHDDSFLAKGAGFGGSVFAYPALEMFRSNEAIFSSVCGFQGAGTLHFALGNQAELAASEFVTGNYFQSLGVAAAAGRPILSSDDQVGAASVAVISFALSRRRFGDPANAVGREVLINNLPFRVVGVAPPKFFGADPGMVADVYLPLHANLLLGNSRAR